MISKGLHFGWQTGCDLARSHSHTQTDYLKNTGKSPRFPFWLLHATLNNLFAKCARSVSLFHSAFSL